MTDFPKISKEARRLLGAAIRSVDESATPHVFAPSMLPHAQELQKLGMIYMRQTEGTAMATPWGRKVFGKATEEERAADPRLNPPEDSLVGMMARLIYQAAAKMGVSVDGSAGSQEDLTIAVTIARAMIMMLYMKDLAIVDRKFPISLPPQDLQVFPCQLCGTAGLGRQLTDESAPVPLRYEITCECCKATTGAGERKAVVVAWNRGEVKIPEAS